MIPLLMMMMMMKVFSPLSSPRVMKHSELDSIINIIGNKALAFTEFRASVEKLTTGR